MTPWNPGGVAGAMESSLDTRYGQDHHHLGEMLSIGSTVKIVSIVLSVIALSFPVSVRANDFTRLVEEGYRWATVNGPYACANEDALRQITTERTDATELRMVEAGDAFYLIPGTLVQIVKDDRTGGMSEILLGGITKPLWTYTRFLTAEPIHDTYDIIEIPQTAGPIDPDDAKEVNIPNPAASSLPQPSTTPESLPGGKDQ